MVRKDVQVNQGELRIDRAVFMDRESRRAAVHSSQSAHSSDEVP